jgi:hypothetical protein
LPIYRKDRAVAHAPTNVQFRLQIASDKRRPRAEVFQRPFLSHQVQLRANAA